MRLAVFMDEHAQAKREAAYHLAFWVLAATAFIGALMFFCLRMGDAAGYQRATEEWARKVATRPAPIPAVDVAAGNCGELATRAYHQCRMSKVRKAG